MWRLPDAVADTKPPLIALMYHGRDTRAYAVPVEELDAYVSARVAHVKAGDPKPLDLRLANGEVIRMQCTVLPNGGRMLCYTFVSDIVRHADELGALRAALNGMQQGIILLDPMLNAQFMNRAVRHLWRVSDEQAERRPSYIELVSGAQETGVFGVPPELLADYIANRVAIARACDPTPLDIPHGDGRVIRSQCAELPGGGRMLTYTDVTDLVHRAAQFEELATIDGLTGVYNRRQFNALALAEWSRFQRYYRPLSVLILDIDHFKQINDRFGHDAGDRTIIHVANLCTEAKRNSDIVARLGGDEFVVLLPETSLAQARTFADRLREMICRCHLPQYEETGAEIFVEVSVGIAEAALSMPSIDALIQAADQCLYRAKAAGRNRTIAPPDATAVDHRAAAE
jgi:diguanylate cyclase (GGDEF)-like protein